MDFELQRFGGAEADEIVRLANEINTTGSKWVKIRDVFEIIHLTETLRSHGTLTAVFGDKSDEIIRLIDEIEDTKSDWVKIRDLVETILLATAQVA